MVLQLAIGAVIGAVVMVFAVMAGLAFIEPGEYGVPAPLYMLLKDIVGPVAAGFGGAVSGALVSYKYQQDTERKASAKAKVRNYNKAVAILASKLNDVGSLKRIFVLPFQNDAVRFIRMPVVSGRYTTPGSAVELLEEILIEHGLHKLYTDIGIVEALYFSVHDSVGSRDRIIEKHRDRADEVSHRYGRRLTLRDVAEIHGVPSLVRLYVYTEDIISLIDECIASISSVMKRLNEECASRVKDAGGKLVRYEDIENEEVFKKTVPPYFKTADELVAAIGLEDYSNSLADRGWSHHHKYQWK